MSNIFRYRAWHKTWSPQSKKDRDFEDAMQQVRGLHIANSGKLWVDMWAWKSMQPAEDVILMRFTGLKDEHQKEIWEDDIILHGSGELRGPGHVKWCQYSLGFKVFRDNTRYDIYRPEVIGNIHQHPHLLAP